MVILKAPASPLPWFLISTVTAGFVSCGLHKSAELEGINTFETTRSGKDTPVVGGREIFGVGVGFKKLTGVQAEINIKNNEIAGMMRSNPEDNSLLIFIKVIQTFMPLLA